ncbi:MAG: PAS domain S-box protein, partial [Candidatus Binataceae bacterium]
LEGCTLFVNAAGREMVGLTSDENLSETKMWDYVFEADRERFSDKTVATVRRDARWSGELRLRNFQSGAPIAVEHHAFAVKDDSTGLVIALATVSVDISERKRLEAERQESHERWRAIFDNFLVGLGMVSPDGRILEINRAFQKMIGYSEAELLGLKYNKIIHPEDLAMLQAAVARILERGARDEKFEFRYLRKDGSYFWAAASPCVIPASDPRPAMLAAIVEDISERKAAEEALAQAHAELAHVTRITTMGELTASIAHEINQPLAAIVTNGNACLRWLGGDAPNLEEARATVGRIIHEGNRAADLISNMRAFATKNMTPPARVDLNELIAETIALIRQELVRHRVQLQTDLAASLPAVLCHRIQLQQVLLNLMVNALEAMSAVTDRSRELIVRSNAQEQQGIVAVAVSDCGGGVEPQCAERLFEPFFTTKREGLGMGLAICRSIINAHGGRLWAAPNPGHGTTFQFIIHCDGEHIG